MVFCTSRTILKGKNKDGKWRRRQQRRSETSSTSSSSRSTSTQSTSSVADEGNLNKLTWPSRREDCEWMADKVKLGGRHADLDSGPSQENSFSYSCYKNTNGTGTARTPSKTRRRRRESRRKTAAKTTPPATSVTESKATATYIRQPLNTITADKRLNEASTSAFRPACTIPAGWHRALQNLLSQAEKDRVVPAMTSCSGNSPASQQEQHEISLAMET